MATKLDRDLTRETTLNVNDKQIMITITKNQSILLKLKGERSMNYLVHQAKNKRNQQRKTHQFYYMT
jgi:hypothetical protein